MLFRFACISFLAWGVACFSVHAQELLLDKKFKGQEDDKGKTLAICENQYQSAAYLFVRPKKEGSEALGVASGLEDDIDGFRFIATPKGVQAVRPSVVQQPSGKWKCERGSISAPMLLGKEYIKNLPLLRLDCLRDPFSPSFYRQRSHSCSSKSVVYRTQKRMIKIEQCLTSLDCLVFYRQDEEGKASRAVIGVSLKSIQALFPYQEKISSYYTMYTVRIGSDDLDCPAYHPENGQQEAYEWMEKTRIT